MATFKHIQPTAENISNLQNALNLVDCLVQGAHEKVSVAAASIKLMLKEPDSVVIRSRIKALCDLIDYHSSDVMNLVNCEAEEFGAHYVNKDERKEDRQIADAARG